MTHKLKPNHLFKYFLLAAFLLTLFACDDIGMSEQQMLKNAKSYMDEGELMAATIELRNTLKKNNENAEARYLLGDINLKVGDLASAEKEFSHAAEAGWSPEDVQLQLARIFISKKSYKKLLDDINPVETWPVDSRANIMGLRALAQAGLNDITNAKSTLDDGRSLNKNAIQVLRSTAILQLAGIVEGNASSTLETAESLYPDNTEILLLQAANDIQDKKFSQAADTYSKIIALNPAKFLTSDARKARINLARLQVVKKNYDEAGTTLEPLLKNNNKSPEANYLAGLIAFDKGDLGRAEEHIDKLLAVLPGNVQAHQLMGKIKYTLKNFEQSAQHFTAYLKANPDDNTTRILLANCYILLNQPDQARFTLQSALDANPDDAAALTLLSQLEFNTGHIDAGIAALRKAITSDPKNAQLHKQLAKAYIRTGQAGLAQDEINIFQTLSNDTEEAQKLAISSYLSAGQINKALEIANQLLTKEPDNPNILALIGGLYANNGDNQSARSYFSKALKIQENHPAAAMGLAGIERKSGNLDNAILLYKSLVDSNKAGTIAMLELSGIAAQQKRTKDMISWLEKARNTKPSEIRARMILTKYYLQDAQPDKAEIYIKEAIKQSPEQADIIALHGKTLIAQKRYNEALPILKKLVAKSPESARAQTLLGEAFLRQHMLADARKHLQKALMVQQDNIIAMSLLTETELKDGKPDKSLEYARAVQKQQPELYIGHMLEGDAWMMKKNHSRARSAYNNAWNRQQSSQLAKRLFLASKDTNGSDKALAPLITWLENNPDDYATRFYLAAIYQNAKEHGKAITEYERILQQTPDDSAVLNNLAWLYSLNGNPKAMDMAESAYRFSPENPGILDTYGWILLQHGQVEKGQRLIKQALDVIPENLDIRYHYASALLKSGNDAEGKKILEALLKQDKPFNGQKEAKQLLKNL